MNAVVFYSNTGNSEPIAAYLAEQLSYPLIDIEKAVESSYNNLVLVFPVHCQNIPYRVRIFLQTAKIKHLSVIATYGKMCYGNVIYEIQKQYCENIVAAAYIPIRHSYIEDDDTFLKYDDLLPIVEKVQNPSTIIIPGSYKNPVANLFPNVRSRMGLKISKNTSCNNCGICTASCRLGAIKNGVTNSKCIRCLKCVKVCPNNALSAKKRLPLKLYLCKKKVNKLIVYI